ncbi:hypothetical protein, partial [Proteus mirabilis]|uniref:hypothetical protein n=1 Tax=Proteus mirabilis TaxID=584 RepID=UPI0013D7889D
ANVVASRANRAIYQIRYLAWRSIAEADNTSLRANEAEYIKTFEELGQMLGFVRDNSPPAYGAQAERIAAKVATTFRGQLDIAMAHAIANRNAEALAQQIRNTPLFNEITRDLGELRDGLA